MLAALVLLLLGDGGLQAEVPRVRAESACALPEPVTLGPELSAVAGLGETVSSVNYQLFVRNW